MATPRQIAEHRADLESRAKINVYMNPGIRMLEDAFTITAEDLDRLAVPVDTRFRVMMADLYVTEGASGGERWKELSPDYLKQKERKWGKIAKKRAGLLSDAKLLPRHYLRGAFRPMLGEFKILQLTRRLRMSLTSRNADHVLDTGKVGEKSIIRLGTRVPYAAFHAEDTPWRRDPIQRTAAQDAELGRVAIDALRPILKAKVRMLAGVA